MEESMVTTSSAPTIAARPVCFPAGSPGDPQSGRSPGCREKLQQRDVDSNTQISRTDSRETSLLRTRLAPCGSSCGSAIEASNIRCQIDAGARWRPDGSRFGCAFRQDQTG